MTRAPPSPGSSASCLGVQISRARKSRNGSGQHRTSIDWEHGTGDEAVAHQVEVGRGDLIGLAHRLGQRPLGQRGEQRRPTFLRDRVPQWRADRSGPDRVDPDRGQLDGQPPG